MEEHQGDEPGPEPQPLPEAAPEPTPPPGRKLFVHGFRIEPILYAGDLEDGSLQQLSAQPFVVLVNDLEQWATFRWPKDREAIEAQLAEQDEALAAERLNEPEPASAQPPTGTDDPVT